MNTRPGPRIHCILYRDKNLNMPNVNALSCARIGINHRDKSCTSFDIINIMENGVNLYLMILFSSALMIMIRNANFKIII